MKEFFAMSGYAAYVWWAYGLTIGGLLLNVWWARRNLRVAREDARRRLAMQDMP